MVTSPAIITELQQIAEANKGVLKAEDVVEHARSPSSSLHNWFTWDDTEAAHNWRLSQARQLIRVTVTMLEDGAGNTTPMRVFVSLTPDRINEGGGYRNTVTVLSNKEARQQLLADALSEMQSFEKKYAALKELAEVFESMKRTRKRFRAA